MFSEIYIDDYINFNRFCIDFPNYKEDKKPNLNILVGRNGSGKSCLLDALYEIGLNNLKSKTDKEVDNTTFHYQILLGNFEKNILCENPKVNQKNFIDEKERLNNLWDKVIRLYTGNTKRQNNYAFSHNTLSLGPEDTKWAFLSIFLSGKWQNMPEEEKNLWNDVQKIVLGFNPDEKEDSENIGKIEPKIIWIETKAKIESGDEYYLQADDFYDWSIMCPEKFIPLKNGHYRYFWNLEDKITCNPDESPVVVYDVLTHILELKNEGKIINTGFLFYKTSKPDELLVDQLLSDGEHALLNRFALLMVLRDLKEKCLILLDEPETHFNEYWKTWFLHLVCEALKNKNCDVFIATHSAMLITDAKPEEVHRLEVRGNKIVHHPVPISTYGANVVDIGQSLFKMEADIGKRSRDEIKKVISEGKKDDLEKLLKQVGPGEWRWRIRVALKEVEAAKRRKKCIHYVIADGSENTQDEEC